MHKFSYLNGNRWLTLWMNLKADIRKKRQLQAQTNSQRARVSEQLDSLSRAQKIVHHFKSTLHTPSYYKDNLMIQNADQEILQMEGMLGKLQAINEVISSQEEIQEVQIDRIINEILDRLQEHIIQNNIFIRIYADEEIVVFSKPRLLQLILENLIENAIKFYNPACQQSYVELNIRKESSNLYFTIEDNGIGIKEQSFDKIFNLFYKDSAQAKGGGLGLYIVREALQKLDAQIDFDSEEGCFTKVNIQIPIYKTTQKSLRKEPQSID